MAKPIIVHYTDAFCTRTEHPSGTNSVLTQTHVPPDQAPEAYNPVELLTIASAACAMSMVGVAAETHGFKIEGMYANSSFELQRKPTRVTAINIEIHLKDLGYTEHDRRVMQRAVSPCPVTASLDPSVEKNITFIFE